MMLLLPSGPSLLRLAAAAAAVLPALLPPAALACDVCEHAHADDIVLTRHARRMQPEAQAASTRPRGPLEWGQLNFLHTTDTHGWLEGHLKEQNYGADWGDFASFTKLMRAKARLYGRDLLLVDTGDLHDGNGLSDATKPNGNVSNVIFENLDYDLLTIGNHELYVSEIAYETFSQFAKVYGDRYLTSNVQILNPASGQYEYLGAKFRRFTTERGLRVQAYGVLFDFTGNSNASKVIPAATMLQQQWFKDSLNTSAVDVFVLIGHNPVRNTAKSFTLTAVQAAIRAAHPDAPIAVFGGHTHIRDLVVYDPKSIGLEAGRYCETLGWMAVDGVSSKPYRPLPLGVPRPSQPGVKVANTTTANATSTPQPPSYGPPKAPSQPLWARRYIDWNRLSFVYHSAKIEQLFDTPKGVHITHDITAARKNLNLTSLYGCAPQTWCQSCQPFLAPGNIFSLCATALAATVVNQTRADKPRIIIINTGSIRFDLPQGPFTYDDSFIVAPFNDAFQFLPDVPYAAARQVLGILNAGAFQKRDAADPELTPRDFAFAPLTGQTVDACVDPQVKRGDLSTRSPSGARLIRRQDNSLKPGYVTKDDFGSNGDDTPHSPIPYYSQPNDLQANASFPANGSDPQTVDVVFLDFIQKNVLAALKQAGATYSSQDVSYYVPENFTTNSYLPAYAKIAPEWRKPLADCPVGLGIGSSGST